MVAVGVQYFIKSKFVAEESSIFSKVLLKIVFFENLSLFLFLFFVRSVLYLLWLCDLSNLQGLLTKR